MSTAPVIGAHHGALQGGGVWTPPSGCVRWHYGSSTTDGKWTDRLGGSAHATLVGSPTLSANGITCASGKYATTGDVGDGYTALTVCAWVYKTSTSSSGMVIISKRSTWGPAGIPFEVQKYGNSPYDMRGYVRGNNNVCPTGEAISVNAWHHVALTWDGDTAIAYLDGVGHAAAADVSLADNDAAVAIGALPGGAAPFIGNIDDVQLYSAALSADDLADIRANSPGTHAT